MDAVLRISERFEAELEALELPALQKRIRKMNVARKARMRPQDPSEQQQSAVAGEFQRPFLRDCL